jgi:hypothetical protein
MEMGMAKSFAEDLKERGFRPKNDVDYADTLIKRGPHGLCVEVWGHDGLDEEAFGQGAIPKFALTYDPTPNVEQSPDYEMIYYEQPDAMNRAFHLLAALDDLTDMMTWTPANAEGDRPGVMRPTDDKSLALAVIRKTSKGEWEKPIFAAYWSKIDRATTKAGSRSLGGNLDLVKVFDLVKNAYEAPAPSINAPAF